MDNPRKKLYNSLIASTDPDVKEHFSQWSEDEFDKKLTEDKKFQKDLFLDLRDIGVAKDEASFTKEYLTPVKAPAPVSAKPAEAPKEPYTYGALDITSYGPIGAIKKGVSGLVTAAKQFVGLKSTEPEKPMAQKKSAAGSVDGFAEDDLSVLGRYESTASAYTSLKKQKKQAEKPIMSRAAFEGPEYMAAPGMSPEDKKAYEKTQKEYKKTLSEATPVITKQVEVAAKRAKEDPNAYIKDRYGKTAPNPEWVAKEARNIASKGGASAGGYAENFLQSNLESALIIEQKAPEFKEEADKIALKKYGKKMSDLYSEDVYKNVTPVDVQQSKLKLAVKKAGKTIEAEYQPKFDAVNNTYALAVENYKKSVANDPSIKQSVNEYDAKVIAELQKGVDEGSITVEQANAMLTSKDSVNARNAYINGIVDQKFGGELKSAYNKYLTDVNALNNRRNSRLRRQTDELNEYFKKDYEQKLETAKQTYKISPQRLKLLTDIQKEAYKNVMDRDMADKRRADMNASVWENFVSSSLKGLGEGIQSTAFTLGMEDVASFGNMLAKNFETSDLNINSWNDVGFGREGATKFAMSAGSILGRMAPGLAASAGIAAATSGAGLGTLPSMLLTAVPSAAFETADIMGSIEQQMLSQSGGDIAKAQEAGARALESQLKIWPAYLLDGLPFFPKVLKFAGKSKYAGLNVFTRGATAAGLDIVTETLQEVPQNVFEEVILEEKDPTFANLIQNTTAEKIANTSASVVSISLLMGAGPQVVEASKDAIAKRAAAGYFAKQVLGQASHPGLQAENQTQFLTQLADEKGERFAAQMVNVLFQKGNIDKVKAEALANKLNNFQRFKETSLGQSDNPIKRQAGFILFDKYMEAKNSRNEQAQESALAALNDYGRTGNAELVMLRLPDGSYNVYDYEDLNSLMDDENFQQASRESNEKYGAVFEITPLVQTEEGLQNPRLQQIIQRFEDIKKAPIEEVPTEKEQVAAETISDEKILEGQKRSGFELPKLFDIIPVEAAAVLDAVRSQEPGVTSQELKGASNAIYQIHKMYEKMRTSTTRNLTLDQIDKITEELEQAITDLENQKTRLAVGDEEMDSLLQQDSKADQEIDTVTQPVETPAPLMAEQAPTVTEVTPASEAAAETAQAPEKPKAKVNVFTDEDVVESFSQKESDEYDRLLFEGKEDLADQMIRDKRRQLVGKEVELLDVGQISEKVRQSFAKAGIDVELLSADEFVQKLKEAGESAERTTEGVFDDKNGKIYVNKDAIGPGWGTTVVWHEAIHPIMNIIHNSNKALYDKIHKGILANAKANPRGQMADVIKWVNGRYNRPGDTDATRKDEIIVEALARLASGRMSFSELQPTLRQQFIDLINRIGRILGLSKAEVSDMKAIKDLAKKITETIQEGRDLSEIVGAENIGKYKRTGALAASLGERGEMSLQKNGTGIALEGNEKVIKGKNAPTVSTDRGYEEDYSLSDIMNTDLAPGSRAVTLALNIAKGDVSYKDKKSDDRITVILPYKNDAVRKKIEKLRNKFSSIKGSSKSATEEKAKIKSQINVEAKKILQEFTELMAQNILALYDTLSPKFMEISKQWYVGANRMANALASKYDKSIEQVSGIIAALSPQKDWFNNVSAAERVIDIMANHADTKLTQEIVDKAVDYNTDKSTKRPKLNEFAVNLIDFFKLYGEVSINELNNRGLSTQTQAVVLRAIDHAINSPKVAMTDPNGKFIGYDSTPIRWNGFGEIGKAMFMYRSSSIEDINSQLGNGNKVRNFYNNIVDPNSSTPYVTADTHAISAAWAAPMSAEDASGVGLFLGSKEPLYALVKDAYIKAANIVGILPREMQSITWEAQRVGINNKNRTEDQKESNFAYIADTRENSQTPYERATELIARNISTNPEWGKDRGIVTQRSVDEIREGAKLRSEQRIGEISDLRGRARGELGGAAAELGERPAGRSGAEKGAITQKSLGGRKEFVNTPLGVGKGLKNVASQNEDVITTKISVAPFYSVKVKNIDEANAVLSTPAFIRYKKDIEDIAKAAGIKIKNIDDGIGGFAFDDGTIVKEATTVLEVTGSWQNIVDFAALSGALTPEVQESTIAGRYVNENTKEHNADEYTVQIDNTEAAFQAAIDAGFDTAGFTLLNEEIRFYNVFKYRIEDILEKIDTFEAKYIEYGGNIKGEAKRPVQSEYIDYDDRADALAKIAADALQPGSNWAGLRDRIDFAQKRNEAFRDWKKVKKSKKAKEYEKLRREQIEAGSRGDVLSDKKLERIKKLEKFFEAPLTTVVSTDEEKYLEAKAEIDAIANDVAKMVAGGFASPFKIKRPARAAIKVVRWYSLNPNMLGDGSRTNIIVNTNQDADYLFQQIRDRFTIPGDRVEYDMPTGLGYPKRLIEIRTSNGKIAEIQVMTPQGYLAKDGIKDFPDDKQDLAREALSEVQDRLGWKIPDGVGHYFYEIERDTNVQNELRKEAIRVSNLYYEAFLNPDSTLSDSEFRKAISDFKDRVDNADKSKWDETNKGEAPASLVEYLGGKPQPSLGERQAAPSFAELDEILDMSPVKSRAAREKLIDQYGKETVDRMIEISRNFTKIINGLEEQGVVEKDCP